VSYVVRRKRDPEGLSPSVSKWSLSCAPEAYVRASRPFRKVRQPIVGSGPSSIWPPPPPPRRFLLESRHRALRTRLAADVSAPAYLPIVRAVLRLAENLANCLFPVYSSSSKWRDLPLADLLRGCDSAPKSCSMLMRKRMAWIGSSPTRSAADQRLICPACRRQDRIEQ